MSKSSSSSGHHHGKDATLDLSNDWPTGLNLSGKASTSSSLADDAGDAPLNLCMKSDSGGSKKGSAGDPGSGGSLGMDLSSGSGGTGSNSLQSLSTITAALGSGSGNDRK